MILIADQSPTLPFASPLGDAAKPIEEPEKPGLAPLRQHRHKPVALGLHIGQTGTLSFDECHQLRADLAAMVSLGRD